MFTSINTTLKQLAQEALHLTPVQRAELADFLVESLHSAQPKERKRGRYPFSASEIITFDELYERAKFIVHASES